MYIPKQIGRYTVNIAGNYTLLPRNGIINKIEGYVRKTLKKPVEPWALWFHETKLAIRLTEEEKQALEKEREFHQKVIDFSAAINVMRYPPTVQK